MLNKVTSALNAIEGFPGMIVTEVRELGRERNLRERRTLQNDEFKEKVCIEIVTPNEKAQQIVDALVGAARTSESGDGNVFVWPVESGARIHACEIDNECVDATLTLLNFNDFRIFQLASNR
jgi:nitrogen regulatory protein P-II 1